MDGWMDGWMDGLCRKIGHSKECTVMGDGGKSGRSQRSAPLQTSDGPRLPQASGGATQRDPTPRNHMLYIYQVCTAVDKLKFVCI